MWQAYYNGQIYLKCLSVSDLTSYKVNWLSYFNLIFKIRFSGIYFGPSLEKIH